MTGCKPPSPVPPRSSNETAGGDDWNGSRHTGCPVAWARTSYTEGRRPAPEGRGCVLGGIPRRDKAATSRVAKSELTFSTPTLAKMAVRAAKAADARAQSPEKIP